MSLESKVTEKMSRALSLIYCLIPLLTGCMVGPKYHKPETAMPESFEETSEAEIANDQDLCRWWEQFEDPLLNELIAEAVKSNYDWRIALEQIFEVRAQYRIQKSYLWPEVDLNASATRARFSDNLFSSSSNTNSTASGSSPASIVSGNNFPVAGTIQDFFQVGFDAVWELDFFGKYRRNKQQAFDLWEKSKETAQNVLIIIVSEVARDYVSIRALQKQIDLLNEKIEMDKRELELAEVLFNAGLDNQIQVENLLSSLQGDLSRIPVLETTLKQTIFGLAVLLGRQSEGFAEEFAVRSPIPSGAGKVPVSLPSDLLRRRPDIRMAERQLAAATEKIGAAIADYFPHVFLTGNTYGFESARASKWLIAASRYWNVGPSLNWDLINFGRTRAQVDVSKSLQRQALLTYEQTVVSSLKDVEGALVAYFEEQKRMISFDTQVEASRRVFDLTNDLFTSGLADESQVLSAKKALLDAQTSYVQSQQALTGDLIALYKALGGEWECTSSP